MAFDEPIGEHEDVVLLLILDTAEECSSTLLQNLLYFSVNRHPPSPLHMLNEPHPQVPLALE